MNELGKNITISLILGGIWAVILHTIMSTSLFSSQSLSILFYPSLFLGFLFINAFYFDLDIGLRKIFLTGLAAGLGYYFLSIYFPLLAILFIAVVLAAGFTLKSNSKADFISILFKGLITLPIGIFITDLLMQFSGIFINHQILSWFILAAVINACFMITIIPISRLLHNKSERADENIYRKADIDDFRSETGDIIKDLDSIQAN